MGFGKEAGDVKKEHAIKALREFLRPEFLGRVDEIVVFNELTEENYRQIAVLMLGELQEALQDKGIALSFTDDLPALLVSKMDGNVRGARDLRNVLRRNVEDKLSTYLVEHSEESIRAIRLTLKDGEVELTLEK